MTRRPGGRPAGSFGPVTQALLSAAEQGAAPVTELCRRAQVGYAVGRYTASRLRARGELVPLAEGRPAVLALAPRDAAASDAGWSLLQRSFWEQPTPDAPQAAFDAL